MSYIGDWADYRRLEIGGFERLFSFGELVKQYLRGWRAPIWHEFEVEPLAASS
jgi:hypothetical protein